MLGYQEQRRRNRTDCARSVLDWEEIDASPVANLYGVLYDGEELPLTLDEGLEPTTFFLESIQHVATKSF